MMKLELDIPIPPFPSIEVFKLELNTLSLILFEDLTLFVNVLSGIIFNRMSSEIAFNFFGFAPSMSST
jgi:hypothetical protein